MKLVTLQQARDHLRSDETDDDADLELKIAGASAAVLRYVTVSRWEPVRDEDGVPILDANGKETPALDGEGKKIVRTELQIGTLLMVAYLCNERDGSNKHGDPFFLPAGVTTILYDLRKPTAV
ncbi:MAG: head-tail connector protein [Pseudorhodoferax sp.]